MFYKCCVTKKANIYILFCTQYIMFKMSIEIEKDEIQFDEKTNRIVVSVEGKDVRLSPIFLRDLLPTKTDEEKARELAMIVHEIEKEKLLNLKFFVEKVKAIDDEIAKAVEKLAAEDEFKALYIKKWQAVIDGHGKRKIVLAEIRRAINLLEKWKEPLRTKIAALGFDPSELTQEK